MLRGGELTRDSIGAARFGNCIRLMPVVEAFGHQQRLKIRPLCAGKRQTLQSPGVAFAPVPDPLALRPGAAQPSHIEAGPEYGDRPLERREMMLAALVLDDKQLPSRQWRLLKLTSLDLLAAKAKQSSVEIDQ